MGSRVFDEYIGCTNCTVVQMRVSGSVRFGRVADVVLYLPNRRVLCHLSDEPCLMSTMSARLEAKKGKNSSTSSMNERMDSMRTKPTSN